MTDQEEPKELKPLSKKHQKVLNEYLLCFNQTAAYRKAYPSVAYDSARTSSARLFAGDNFSAHLKARLDEVHMSADEALKLMADIARGDIGDFMAIGPVGFSLDLEAAREANRTSLIKRISEKKFIDGKKETETYTVDIELYDRQAAIRDILKIHGKFLDRVDLTSGGKPISWKEFISGDADPDPDRK